MPLCAAASGPTASIDTADVTPCRENRALINNQWFSTGLKPEKFSKKGFKGPVPRGVSNRMAALEWIRQNARDGVFYFADDDNTYDHRLFAEVGDLQSSSVLSDLTQSGLARPGLAHADAFERLMSLSLCIRFPYDLHIGIGSFKLP